MTEQQIMARPATAEGDERAWLEALTDWAYGRGLADAKGATA